MRKMLPHTAPIPQGAPSIQLVHMPQPFCTARTDQAAVPELQSILLRRELCKLEPSGGDISKGIRRNPESAISWIGAAGQREVPKAGTVDTIDPAFPHRSSDLSAHGHEDEASRGILLSKLSDIV